MTVEGALKNLHAIQLQYPNTTLAGRCTLLAKEIVSHQVDIKLPDFPKIPEVGDKYTVTTRDSKIVDIKFTSKSPLL